MENKPICDIDKHGNKFWYIDGNLLRVERHDGITYWYGPGKILHRLDGPAVIWNNHEPEWWINDKQVTNEITQWAEENDIDLGNLSDVDKLLLKITWS